MFNEGKALTLCNWNQREKSCELFPERQADTVLGWMFLGTVSSLDFIFNGVGGRQWKVLSSRMTCFMLHKLQLTTVRRLD